MSLQRLKKSIEEFVDHNLPAKPPKPPDRKKIIHESVWGTHLYNENEIVFLDTPLIQRLRRIHQTGFAFYTFPTAVHSRFDHTLGTINRCSRLVEELSAEGKESRKLVGNLKTPVRLAALLHDCGHGIFSHTSEEIYGLSGEIQEASKEGGEFEDAPQPHELLSSLIVRSQRFRDFYEKVTNDGNLGEIADLIIGNAPKELKYQSEILNSIFDGDKIDYIHRDAHFSGLPLRIDLDRLWYGIDIKEILIKDDVYRKLSISRSATEPLEQMIFHKTMLSPTLYQHQKVRACDCMFKGIVEYIRRQGLKVKMGHKEVSFQNPEDFLWGTDDEFFGIASYSDDSNLTKRIDDLLTRHLFHRAIAISNRCTDDDGRVGLASLMKLRDNDTPEAYSKLREVAADICEAANKEGFPVLPEDIWIDLPAKFEPSPDIEDAYVFFEEDRAGGKYEFIPAVEIFPINDWARQIDLHKWQGSVFCPAGMAQDIGRIARNVIEEQFAFQFKDQAFIECHNPPPER